MKLEKYKNGLNKLYTIIRETTQEFRKGPEVIERRNNLVKVIEVLMLHVTEAPIELEKIDCHFIVVGVDKEKAEAHREELKSLLRQYPTLGRLAGGSSYIGVGAVLHSQDVALRLFALGEVLDFWQVITPAKLGFTGSEADKLALRGFVMISGYNEPK